ncbi:hypothetical protein J4E86_002165 [Alternaria arbusti]|uniref:uncharacterized protein n=1 Tax=Alternaria arbusti TaxID=232088 RepID=UPI00221F6504|nr:uncharacterized protein J4E86_002165 [Alternaria arbusti]KAI4960543.1 hypothetical protein J4E86_002165 [Alternaria arbusti]
MLGRTVFAATFFALAQFAMASPPGCLLGAVNQYEDPSDIKAVCKSKDLSSKVAELCGNDAEAAMEAIADICNDVDVDVSTAISSASGSKTATGSSHKPTGTSGSTLVSMYPTGSSGQGSSNGTVPAATGGPKPSGSATGSGGLPEATGAAGKVEFSLAAVVASLIVAAL